jgi:hypothetical protein
VFVDQRERQGLAALAAAAAGQEPPGGHDASETVSAMLRRLAAEWPKPRITLGEMIHAFGSRGYGLLIVLFAVPNLLPIYIPGYSPIFGVPLAIVCLQMALGLPEPRLPAFLTNRSVSATDLRRIVEMAAPRIQRIERWVHPRPSLLTGKLGERLIGAYGVWLAALVIIPLPGTNLPTSLACAIMAIGFLERDTVTIVVGAVFGVAASAFALAIVGGAVWMAGQGLGMLF